MERLISFIIISGLLYKIRKIKYIYFGFVGFFVFREVFVLSRVWEVELIYVICDNSKVVFVDYWFKMLIIFC